MPERLIDIPLESLPYIDEHATFVDAMPERTWEALLAVVGGADGGLAGRRVAQALGCVADSRSGEPGRIGSTIPGFVVSRSVPPAVLALMGEHRFSRYALIFRITEQGQAVPVRLSAETRAEFPGRRGSLYRTFVIGTRGHVLATRAILRRIRRRAERHRD
jgi:hypothetical protein